MTVLAYVPDLMDRSKVAAAAPHAVFVADPEALVATAAAGDLVVVDLGRPGVTDVLPALAAAAARVIGFGSHVDRATLEAATRAGCSEVLARSAFFRDLPALLAP